MGNRFREPGLVSSGRALLRRSKPHGVVDTLAERGRAEGMLETGREQDGRGAINQGIGVNESEPGYL